MILKQSLYGQMEEVKEVTLPTSETSNRDQVVSRSSSIAAMISRKMTAQKVLAISTLSETQAKTLIEMQGRTETRLLLEEEDVVSNFSSTLEDLTLTLSLITARSPKGTNAHASSSSRV
jgi:hypothetical protein